jgi:hypothetical protein
MLFPYLYIDHPMNKMQEYIDFIFFEVWCKAPECQYDISLFDGNVELKEIITAFHYTEPKGADFFVKGIQTIFEIFKNQAPTQMDQLRNWYRSNNHIEGLCKNTHGVEPLTYEEIARWNQRLSEELNAFFVGLYSEAFLSLKVLSDKIGKIGDHYKEFTRLNTKCKCPFCGLSFLDGEYNHTREAYDHYLPKSKYPFSSINFRNLAPICHKCNSSNKGAKDPLHDRSGNRRKAFYAYNADTYGLEISLQICLTEVDNLTPQDINIQFGPAALKEEINTWNELFAIEERYKAVCCSAEAQYWIQQVREANENYGLAPRDFLRGKLRESTRKPYQETNFLRKPFLEACDALHIFD